MVTMKTKGPNGHDGDQRAQWSRWKPKGLMVNIETKGPNGHWKPKGPMVNMETKGPNGNCGNQKAQ